MKIGGIASGIDTESIINSMMQAHRIPLNKMTQKKQYTEWQLANYREVNLKLRAQEEKFQNTMLRQSTFMAKTVNVSHPNALGVKRTNATNEFSGSIKIDQLATQASLIGGKLKRQDGTQVTGSTQLKDLDGFSGITKDSNGNYSITIDAIDKDGNHIAELDADGKPNGKTTKKTVVFSETDTLNSMMSKITKETGVNAFYDEQSGKIALTAKNSGQASNAAVKEIGISGVLADALNLVVPANPDASGNPDLPSYNAGKNAKFTFNGLTTERTSNTFEINGFELTLKETTTGPVTFSSAPDTDNVFNSVKQFVDEYNKLIEELNKKINEKKYRDYHPLSAEEKGDMKDKEIELWEEKAMSGTLRRDPTIESMLSKMRSIMTQKVTTSDGKEVSLRDLGIKPMEGYTNNGKLEIDETKLRAAIEENPNNVYEAFGKLGDGDQGGLVRQLNAVMKGTRDAISLKAGTSDAVNDTFTIGRSLKEMDKQIERFNSRLEMMEARYWKQFTAMEKAMQRANEQSAQLMNSLGGM